MMPVVAKPTPDGGWEIQRKRTGLGCLGWIAVLIALALPAQWPLPWNVVGYIVDAIIFALGFLGWVFGRIGAHTHKEGE